MFGVCPLFTPTFRNSRLHPNVSVLSSFHPNASIAQRWQRRGCHGSSLFCHVSTGQNKKSDFPLFPSLFSSLPLLPPFSLLPLFPSLFSSLPLPPPFSLLLASSSSSLLLASSSFSLLLASSSSSLILVSYSSSLFLASSYLLRLAESSLGTTRSAHRL